MGGRGLEAPLALRTQVVLDGPTCASWSAERWHLSPSTEAKCPLLGGTANASALSFGNTTAFSVMGRHAFLETAEACQPAPRRPCCQSGRSSCCDSTREASTV